jgi:hypothetical protein
MIVIIVSKTKVVIIIVLIYEMFGYLKAYIVINKADETFKKGTTTLLIGVKNALPFKNLINVIRVYISKNIILLLTNKSGNSMIVIATNIASTKDSLIGIYNHMGGNN